MNELRNRLMEKYDSQCWFCGISNEDHVDKYGQELAVHHFVPKGIGGPDTVDNTAVLCCSCHQKMTITYDEMLFALFQDYRELTDATKHLEGREVTSGRKNAVESVVR